MFNFKRTFKNYAKGWEIVLVKLDESNIHLHFRDMESKVGGIESAIISSNSKIVSVKRKKDNVVFSLGESAKHHGVITGFYVYEYYGINMRVVFGGHDEDLSFLEKSEIQSQ